MKVYAPPEDIDLPELDLLTFLFGMYLEQMLHSNVSLIIYLLLKNQNGV